MKKYNLSLSHAELNYLVSTLDSAILRDKFLISDFRNLSHSLTPAEFDFNVAYLKSDILRGRILIKRFKNLLANE